MRRILILIIAAIALIGCAQGMERDTVPEDDRQRPPAPARPPAGAAAPTVTIDLAPASWDCAKSFGQMLNLPADATLYSYKIGHPRSIDPAVEARLWEFYNTPSGGYYHLGDYEEEYVWLCGSSGKYGLKITTIKGESKREDLIELTIP